MTKAPDRIWVWATADDWGYWHDHSQNSAERERTSNGTPYVTLDHANAMVAEAYQASTGLCRQLYSEIEKAPFVIERTDMDACIELKERIANAAPTDAKAALDLLLARERAQALAEAAEICRRGDVVSADSAAEHISALKERST